MLLVSGGRSQECYSTCRADPPQSTFWPKMSIVSKVKTLINGLSFSSKLIIKAGLLFNFLLFLVEK